MLWGIEARYKCLICYDIHYISLLYFSGEMDYWSLHGGCDIIKGTKWLANNWLTAPPENLAHIDSLYMNFEAPGAF